MQSLGSQPAQAAQPSRTRRDSNRTAPRSVCSLGGRRGPEPKAGAAEKRVQSAALVGLAGTFAAMQMILSAPTLAAPQTTATIASGEGVNLRPRELEQSLQREMLFLEMELDKKRAALESDLIEKRKVAELEGRSSQGDRLCATPFGVDVVGITEAIALAGALFGGISARQRKREVEELNEKLRTINVSLRQQARSGMVYAPGLNYAPMAASSAMSGALAPPPPPVPKPARVAPPPPPADAPPDETRLALREGRAKLKEGNGAAGMVFFNKAKMISKMRRDKVQLRRAMRGLAACRRLGGDKLGAIEDLEVVLQLSKEMNDFTGDSDALGAIADMYTARHLPHHTELGDLEKAGFYYDRYINVLTSDSSGKVD